MVPFPGSCRTAIVGLFGIVSCFGISKAEQATDKKQNAPEAANRTIPLESIYATSLQKGLKVVSPAFRFEKDGSKQYVEPYGVALAEIIRARNGASNIFLVRGDDITVAIKETLHVVTGSQSVDSPPGNPVEKSENMWLVMFFGSTSSGPVFLIQTVDISDSRIRVTFAKAQLEVIPLDVRAYYAWAPVGKLSPGNYTLELYDASAMTSRLVRRVSVPRAE